MKYIAWIVLFIGVILICTGASFTDEVIGWRWRLVIMAGGGAVLIIGRWLERKADPEDVPPAPMP